MRMHLKKFRTRKRKIRIYIIILLIIFLVFFLFINKIGTNISSYYLDYSKREATLIIDSAFNKAVTKEILEEMKEMNLYTISRNNDGEIEMIDYNSYLVNDLLNKISTNIYNIVKKEERTYQNASFYVPAGVITKNPLLADKGPKIPVRMYAIGSVLSSIRTEVKDCGINSSLIEMSVHIEITEKVILPISSEEIKISNDIPLSYKIVKGKVPAYYGEAINKNSSIYSLPVE